MRKIFPVLLALLLLTACFAAPASADDLNVAFYDMGKADAMLITTPDDRRILIDTGTNKGGNELAERFEREGIDSIDLMIITHYDKDHVGGADKVIESVAVAQVLIPDYEKDSKQHDQFLEALADSPATRVTTMATKESLAFSFGDVHLSVGAAHETYYGKDEENDFSLVTRMSYGDTRFLFAGDAEDARQTELLHEGDLACDVLKVPYHGRLENASAAFLAACSPEIAFITDSEDDPASEMIIAMLASLGTATYCAKDGGIAVASDGNSVKVMPL